MICGLIGIATAQAFVYITQYYTEYRYRPVREIAESAQTGPATVIITGMAIAFECTAVPIIVISGRPLVQDAAKEPDFLAMAIKLGAISSLPKPFKPTALLKMVESCLTGRDRNVASQR